MRRIIALSVVVLAAGAAHASGTAATTYYVSPTGSDSNSGSASAPWKTIARVNNASLAPGDTVLFQGGSTFSGTLMPSSSGVPGSPITFGSYETGKASITSATGAVWIPAARHDLVFDGLDLSSPGAIVFASDSGGTGTYNIALRNSTVHDSPYAGLHMQTQDWSWTVARNTFRHLGDSGLIVQGNQATINANTITDAGWNTALGYAKHGIYAKAPNIRITNNDFSAIPNGQAISLRYGGAVVFGNTVHDTPYAIGMFAQDPTNKGAVKVYNNRFWNITGWLFYYSGVNEALGTPAGLDVVWTSNTARLASAVEAVNVSEITAASVTIANSVFFGTYGSAYRGCASCSEHNNDWYGGTRNLPAGNGDRTVPPGLTAAPTFAPTDATSPVVDSGTTGVPDSNYASSCDGQPFDFCLLRPDQGAVEYLGSAATTGDTTSPTSAGSLAFAQATPTGGTLTWVASTDNVGVTGYDVYVDGARVGATSATSYDVSGLACGTSHSFGVVAFDAAGNRSITAATTGSTAACSSAPPPPPAAPTVAFSNVADGSVVPRSYTFTAVATDSSGITSLTVAVDGSPVCSTQSPTIDCPINRNGGWHTLSATAVSAAGVSASTSVRVHFAH